MDNFPSRPQDPYEMTDEQRAYVRENIFPYWKGKSVEDAFLARTSAETKKIGVDTGFVDTDSKWRNGHRRNVSRLCGSAVPQGLRRH